TSRKAKSRPCATRWAFDDTDDPRAAMHAQRSNPSTGNHPAQDGAEQDVAFTFVQALAAELSGGKVELPGFPHIVMRVQRVLSDDKTDATKVVRVIGSEP